MTDQVTQSQVNNTAWAACDTFRGVVDAAQYKDYILVMLFLKYISDLWNAHVEDYKKQFGGDETRIRRRLERGLCVRCGYDLRGSTSGVCPECGTPRRAMSSSNVGKLVS